MTTKMLLSALLSLAAITSPAGAVHIAPRADAPEGASGVPKKAPGRFLVEFTQPNAVSQFYSDLASAGVKVEKQNDISSDLFSGASFKLDEKHDEKAATELIDSLAIVKQVWPMKYYYPQRAVKSGVLPRGAQAGADTFSTHVMTGVDKLHAQGLTGKGKHIAIIDTGIDYKHPALGGGFGPGFKVSGGYDLVGDAYDGTNIGVPDPDPYTDCTDHGTHVAGIIGANMNEYNFTGVVPDATLSMYRVFGCTGPVQDDVLIEATLRAHAEKPDAISISIGGASGWTEEPWTVVASRVAKAGTPILLAAGNDGANGLFTGSNAADGVGVIAVGSVDNTQLPELSDVFPYSVSDGTKGSFKVAQSSTPIKNVELPLYATSLDSTVAADACEPLPDNTPDLSGKAVLVRRGSCLFATKAENVAAKGGKYLLFYNNVAGLLQPANQPNLTGVAMTTAEDGANFVKQIAAGKTVTISMYNSTLSYQSSVNNITGGYMSTFSSWYPTNEGYVKPEISGPGGNILSTVPLAQGGYAILSGTSMATPFVAGVVGLLRQARPDLKSEAIRRILGTTGTPLNFNNGQTTSNFLTTVFQQGGGLVNAVKAINTATIIDKANLAFNDTRYFEHDQEFTITNRGKQAITYTLSSVNAASAYSLGADYNPIPVVQFPELVSTGGATIRFQKTSYKVQAGQSQKIKFKADLPTGLDAKRIPVYSGFINVVGSNGDKVNLPYGGIASKLNDATVLSYNATGTPLLTSSQDPNQAPIAPGTSFTLSKDNTTVTNEPYLIVGLAFSSALIRADVVPTDKKAKGTKNTLGVKAIGQIAGYPVTYRPRSDVFSQAFNGMLADGKYAPAGNYTILVRALRVFGNPNKASDYDAVETVPFSISYA